MAKKNVGGLGELGVVVVLPQIWIITFMFVESFAEVCQHVIKVSTVDKTTTRFVVSFECSHHFLLDLFTLRVREHDFEKSGEIKTSV